MRGPGTNEQQIEVMRKKMSENSIRQAHLIVKEYDADTIKLAHKMMRTNITKSRLPKAVTKLLDNLPEEDAKTVRGILVRAQRDPVSVNVRDGGPHYMP